MAWGIARQMGNSTLFAKTVVGTPYYLSPELCEDRPYNTKSDIWALGVLAYEMAAGRHPFDAQNEGALIRKIVKGVYAPLPTQRFSKAFCDLVYGMLQKDPSKRPSAMQFLSSPAVKAHAQRLGLPLDGSPPPARAAAMAAAAMAVHQQDEDLAAELTAKLPPPSAEAIRERTVGANGSLHHTRNNAVAAPSTPPPASPPPPAQRDHEASPAAPHRSVYQTTQQRAQAAAQVQQAYYREQAQARPFATMDGSAQAAGARLHPALDRGEVERAAAAAEEAAAANAAAGRRSDIGSVLAGNFMGRDDDRAALQRMRPEDQPAAGQRKGAPQGGVYATGGSPVRRAAPSPHRAEEAYTAAMGSAGAAAAVAPPFGGAPDPRALAPPEREREMAAAARHAVYTPPQFGRRRARDIAITGPSMRNPGSASNTAARPGSAGRMAGGGYAGARMAPANNWANASIGTGTTTTATTYLMRGGR